PEAVDPARGSAVDSSTQQSDNPADMPLDRELEPGPITKTSLREHPLGNAWVFDRERFEQPQSLAIAQAEARGYTVIDLGDSWVPFIFTDRTPGADDRSENVYAARYRDLANDRTDADGDA